jgi:Mn-containing catalase
VRHPAPEGFPWPDAPAETDVFAPDYAPEEIVEIARKLRKEAGL